MTRLPKQANDAVAILMLIVRIIYALGIAIRNNEPLNEKGIEADAKNTLRKIEE